jgi:hypothetical protein
MLVQFDGDTKLGGKLAKMRSLGFYFLKDDGVTCNANYVKVRFNRNTEISDCLEGTRTCS